MYAELMVLVCFLKCMKKLSKGDNSVPQRACRFAGSACYCLVMR